MGLYWQSSVGPSIGFADCGCAWNRKYLRLQLQLRESGGISGEGPERSCPAANAICEHDSVHVRGAFRGVPYQAGAPADAVATAADVAVVIADATLDWRVEEARKMEEIPPKHE